MNKKKMYILNLSGYLPSQLRKFIYKKFGIIKDNTVSISNGIKFDYGCNVKIGSNSFINKYVQFHNGYNQNTEIVLGNNVFVGMNTTFICVSHNIGEENQRAGNNIYKSIYVNNGTWIGANSTILLGVNIGKGCIIAAGSVVIHDCEDNCLYAGNPAELVKKLN